MGLENKKSEGATEGVAEKTASFETPKLPIYPTPPSSPTHSNRDSAKQLRNTTEDLEAAASDGRLFPKLDTLPHATAQSMAQPRQLQKEIHSPQIRALLGIGEEDSRCGALKDGLVPCRTPIHKATRDAIDHLIDQMRTSKEPSPTFVPFLNKLVKLVHCRYHNCREKTEPRIRIWNRQLCTAFGQPAPVVTIGEQIVEALGPISTLCKGITVKKRNCKQKIGGQKVQNCDKTLEEIMRREVYSNDEYVHQFLRILAANTFCHHHLQLQSEKKVIEWEASIIPIRDSSESVAASGDEKATLMSNDRAEEGNGKATARAANIKLDDSLAGESGSLQLRHPDSTTFCFTEDPADYWAKKYEESPFEIIARSERLSDPQSSYIEIQREIIQYLDKDDVLSGHVYLYEVEANPGLVKIGYTTRTVEERHKEWEFSCNRKVICLYPPLGDLETPVPNAKRVEALVHAELAPRKTWIYCSGCRKPHIEWFEISSAEAIKVVRKWSRWMSTEPYVGNTLKETERERISDIPSFLASIVPKKKIVRVRRRRAKE